MTKTYPIAGSIISTCLLSSVFTAMISANLLYHHNTSFNRLININQALSLLKNKSAFDVLSSFSNMQAASIKFLNNTLQNNTHLKVLIDFLNVKNNTKILKLLLAKDESRQAFLKFLQGTVNETALKTFIGNKAELIQALKNVSANKELLGSLKSLFPDTQSMEAFNKILINPTEIKAFKDIIKFKTNNSIDSITNKINNSTLSRQKIIIALATSILMTAIAFTVLGILVYKYKNLNRNSTLNKKELISQRQDTFYYVIGTSAFLGIGLITTTEAFMLALPKSTELLLNIINNHDKVAPITITASIVALPVLALVCSSYISTTLNEISGVTKTADKSSHKQETSSHQQEF